MEHSYFFCHNIFLSKSLPKKFTLIWPSNLYFNNRNAKKIGKIYMINSCNSIFFFCQKTINTILVISYKLNDEKRDLMRKFSYSIFSKITIKPGCQSIKIQFLVKYVFFKNEPVLHNCQCCELMQHFAVLKSSCVVWYLKCY